MKLFTSHKPFLEQCPVGLKKNILAWKEKNPNFEFEYFTDNEMLSWMEKNSSAKMMECFKSMSTGAGRADLYRVRKLFVEGGIWFDADLPPISIHEKVCNFHEKINKHKTLFFVTKRTNEPRFMIMASNANNPLFEDFENQAIEEIYNCKKNKEFVATINITGPKAFHRCLLKYLKYDKISDLKINDSFSDGNVSFVFLDDVVDHSAQGGAIIAYKGYRQELEQMGVTHHKYENAYN